MLVFQILLLIFVVSYARNKPWIKYVLIADIFVWYIRLQEKIEMPGALGLLWAEIILIFVTFVIYILFCVRQKKMDILKRENALLQEQICRYRLQVQENESYQKNVCRIKHDLKNELLGLNALLVNGEYEQAKQIIDNTLGELCARNCIQTGNVMLDGLANCKIACAEDKNIAIEVEVRIPVEERLNTMPVVVAIGNMLDNAIEACEKIPKERRYIKVKIIRKDSRIFVEVENSFSGEIRINKAGDLITTKQCADLHGHGIKSIKKALKNVGDFIYRVEDEVFYATVILY